MWFLNNKSDAIPEAVCECGIYRFLLGDEPVPFSDALSPLPSFFELPSHQRTQACLALWQLCPLPFDLVYLGSTIDVLQQWLDVHKALVPAKNQWQRNALHQLELAIRALMQSQTQNPALSQQPEVISDDIERSALRSMLTHYPVYVTLLFIASMSDNTQARHWLWFFARLQQAIGTLTYDACLNFDRVRRDDPQCPLSEVELRDATLTELYQICLQHAGLEPLAPYFSATNRHRSETRPKSLPFQSDNAHQETLRIDDDVKVDLVTPTDRQGEAQSAFMQVFPPEPESELGAKNGVDAPPRKACESDPTDMAIATPSLHRHPELSHSQARRQFQLQKVGLSQAIARSHRTHPAGNDALSPTELAMWMQYHCPALFEQDLSEIPAAERVHWFFLLLNMFCGRCDLEQPLVNLGARSRAPQSAPCLVYELDRRDACHAVLRIQTDLFKGAQPPKGSKQYFSSQTNADIPLPWPLQSLLNLILRAVPAHQRHLVSLEEGLMVSAGAHRAWLREKIAQSRVHFPFTVTSARLTQVFHRYSAQRMPSVNADFLAGKGSVQMHYTNVEGMAMTASIHRQWSAFLSAMNIEPQQGWYSETTSASLSGDTYHDQCGSAITLRESLLPRAFEAILSPLFDSSGACKQAPSIEGCERLALYLHIRAAIELGLRPVSSPYPNDNACAWEVGVWTLQDKRVHHQEARRLVALSRELGALLQGYQRYARALASPHLAASAPVLSVFDGNDWQPLSPQILNALLARYLDSVELGSFRHNAAHQVMLEAFQVHSHFVQGELNMRMNHFKRGQNPISQYALCSIRQMAQVQQSLQARISASVYHPSLSSLWRSIAHWDAKVTKWIDVFIQPSTKKAHHYE